VPQIYVILEEREREREREREEGHRGASMHRGMRENAKKTSHVTREENPQRGGLFLSLREQIGGRAIKRNN
jgi:hypothetical protein